ncbi:MBL fold metallo-hydrolase [Streptomyces sp. MNP-20]|uniref:MBL fold metallo-hydrolase n=1 Tax=Streptomyces sp. MNP-20 TaxID=2721165 RepID=UPI001557AA41|nr:MBL fold metallo-hydrolase [Streptomyces sp. MNP-20]
MPTPENTADVPVDAVAPPRAADAAERLRRPARTRTFPLGELRVSYVADGAVGLKPRGWLPAATDSDWETYADHLDERGHLVASVGGLLVEHGDRALLIDAGFGPQAFPDAPDNPLIGALRSGRLLDSLDELGRAPGTIEAVAFTHLHGDHLGWAWNPAPGGTEPAFTRAAYLFAKPEWDQRHLAASHGATEEVLAVLAPKVRTLTDGEEVFPGVRALVRPGHTVGHVTFEITSGGQRLLAFGDALHSPVQVTHPEWSAAVDHDPGVAAEYRHWLVNELTEPGTLGFGVHFADVVFGRAERDSQGRTVWAPLP